MAHEACDRSPCVLLACRAECALGSYRRGAASPGGADEESFTVQEDVHGLPKFLAGDLCNEPPRLDLEDLHSIPCFIRYVEKPAVHNVPRTE